MYYLPIDRQQASALLSAGATVYVYSEQEGDLLKATSLEMLRGYTEFYIK
jgi:hypothetical protein